MGELLVAQLPKFDNKRIRLAEAIGLTPSRLTRAIKGEYALDVRNCLRLARVAGLPPSDVLRAAGKGDIADLIEDLYGEPQAIPVVSREAIDLLNHVYDPEDVTVILGLLRRFARDPHRVPLGTKPLLEQARESQATAHGSRAKVAGRRR